MQLTAHEHSTEWTVDGSVTQNAVLGIRAEPRWFGDGSVFAMTHHPAGEPIGSVVICPPTHAEVGRNQRRELLASWELAMCGYTVTRVDYRGLGHSAGNTEDMSFDTMVADVLDAASILRPGWYVGTRAGALVAAAAASATPESNLVLWEPVESGQAWFKEVFRASMMGALKRGEKWLSGAARLAEFERVGYIDVVGNTVGWPLYSSLEDRTLSRELKSFGGDAALLVQIQQKAALKPANEAIVAQLTRSGRTIETLGVEHNEPWWFGATPRDDVVLANVDAPEAITATVEFISKIGGHR